MKRNLPVMFLLLVALSIPKPSFEKGCEKEEVCALARKMNPFAILDKCPGESFIIRNCKNFELQKVKDLPVFIDKGDTILDKANELLLSKTELSPKLFSYKDVVRVVSSVR